MLFEVLLHLQCSHAAGAGGGDGLAVAAVLDVSAGEDAGDAGEDVIVRLDVSVGVEVDLSGEDGGVGDVSDAQKQTTDRQDGFRPGDGIAQAEAEDFFLLDSENLLDGGVGAEMDLGVGHGPIQHDFRGAELLAAVQQGDLSREPGEEERLFHGGVAAPDDGDLPSGEEEAVAGGAGADAVSDEGLLGGQAEPARGGSAGDDEGVGADGLGADLDFKGAAGEVGGGDVAHAELGAEAGGLLLHVLDELGALDALGPAGEVFDQGGDGELAAGLVAFDDERLEVGARGVDGCGEAGAAGSEDDGVAYGVGHDVPECPFDCTCLTALACRAGRRRNKMSVWRIWLLFMVCGCCPPMR